MKKLLSLPQNLVDQFFKIENKDEKEWFCAADPIEKRVGSGGGTSWLLFNSWKSDGEGSFRDWVKKEKRIIIHAGGQSRRLPSYAPSGKILCPIPIFRWERSQKIDQNLLDLQIPLYEEILSKSSDNLRTIIASGDIYVRAEECIDEVPDADIVCYGLWADPEQATNHGVFVCDNKNPKALVKMLQKPSVRELQEISSSHLFFMDIGVWVLSERAVEVLLKKSGYLIHDDGRISIDNELNFYDLYSDFGLGLGSSPSLNDDLINSLSVAIVNLPNGEFYHYGTSKELISSTLKIQNKVVNQQAILHKDMKPHSSIFVQNSDIKIKLEAVQRNLWIENSFIGKNWSLHSNHIITGIPENNWNINLEENCCLDIVPIGNEKYCVRPYGFYDAFRGGIDDLETLYLGSPIGEWLNERGILLDEFKSDLLKDIQLLPIFPIVDLDDIESAINWFICASTDLDFNEIWMSSEKLSANEILEKANLVRLYEQRTVFRNLNIPLLHKNYKKSVFYQLDLDDVAQKVVTNNINLEVNDGFISDSFFEIQEQMLQARIHQISGKSFSKKEQKAFQILGDTLIDTLNNDNQHEPILNVYQDQIVWGRSPVRIDVAGGWSDTPPFSLLNGGSVVNLAIELNGQPPLQVFIKPTTTYKIVLRSIDIGSREIIEDYESLMNFKSVGSEFSITKAALYLVGFHPKFSNNKYTTLKEQLMAFGSGIEISTLAAIPKGSGLGTSSILASTILGALSDFCKKGWDYNEICHRTLVLEQLLTTGGGWQDQYGGILPGIKLLETSKGFLQKPHVKWAPDYLFTNPEYSSCMLLYYTGVTRTAKNILSEIVRKMFLNERSNNFVLNNIKQHAKDTFETLQENNFEGFASCVDKAWGQNKLLDYGTNPPEIEAVIKMVKDYTLAVKLPGAGGGGYLYMIAKDPEAAGKIRKLLNANPINKNARFVDMKISSNGLQITRS